MPVASLAVEGAPTPPAAGSPSLSAGWSTGCSSCCCCGGGGGGFVVAVVGDSVVVDVSVGVDDVGGVGVGVGDGVAV